MGGNLLKTWNLPDKRIPNDQYVELARMLGKKFQTDTGCMRIATAIAPSIRNKTEHGDLDINVAVIDSETTWLGLSFSDYILKEFGYKPHRNANTHSFPVDGFQVDVTFVPPVELDMTQHYSSWGDLGNIMGRVFHKMGLHYGHTGLSFWIRQGMFDHNIQWSDSDHVCEKVVLTQDMDDILDLGGFSRQWFDGFDTEEQAFEFVISSKYFDPALFALENLNHTNRTRNRKRGMYMRFIEYLAAQEVVARQPFRSKEEYSLLMQMHYPHLQKAIDKHRFDYQVKNVIKQKVNGTLVMEWLNTDDGVLVGNVMNFVRRMTATELMLMSSEDIKNCVLSQFA